MIKKRKSEILNKIEFCYDKSDNINDNKIKHTETNYEHGGIFVRKLFQVQLFFKNQKISIT